jgi:WXG100 family type VII secretion target
VPEPIKVDPDDVTRAAERVRDHADRLRAGHGSALATADGTRSGLVGQSARAIEAKAQRWQTTTAELHRALTSQADALAHAASAYAGTEEASRDMIESLDPTSL